jgi:hypothetical protein
MMIRITLERRFAIVATAALTLAIWALPASAASGTRACGRDATSSRGFGDLDNRLQRPAACLVECYTVTSFFR